MSLGKVILDADVYSMCLQHALTTEKEEIMGVLIGDVNELAECSMISAMYILHRADKQADRVEISVEQLVSASTYAENLMNNLKSSLRVVGWYHSHPHITVLPSHVDVNTQTSYQIMDKYFVGLIFSVFPQGANILGNSVELTAFQAKGSVPNLEPVIIPIEIVDSPRKVYNLEALTTLPTILIQEENETRKNRAANSVDDAVTLLHNDAYKTISHLHIIQTLTDPLLESLSQREIANRKRIDYLKTLRKQLTQPNILNCSNSSYT